MARILPGPSNWKLILRRKTDSVTVLHAVTCDSHAVLPDRILVLPVTELGPGAFSRQADIREDAEEIWISNGALASHPVWSNETLHTLQLPPTIRAIQNLAFSNCRELSRLELSDSIETWGSGIFSGCCKLLTFHIHCSGPACSATAVWQIARTLTGNLDITVDGSGGPFRLIFPEYEEYEEENLITQAVLFSFHISGAGYPYHHCFTGRTLDLFRYDSTWREFMALNYQPLDAVRIAFWRLFYPVGLLEQHQAAYLQFLRSHTDLALTWLTQTRNSDGLSFLLSQTEPEKDALRRACTLARTLSYTQGAAILLEALHQRFPAAQTPVFDL